MLQSEHSVHYYYRYQRNVSVHGGGGERKNVEKKKNSYQFSGNSKTFLFVFQKRNKTKIAPQGGNFLNPSTPPPTYNEKGCILKKYPRVPKLETLDMTSEGMGEMFYVLPKNSRSW